jgi:hypothetical protein
MTSILETIAVAAFCIGVAVIIIGSFKFTKIRPREFLN